MTFRPYTHYFPPAPGSRYFNEDGSPYTGEPQQENATMALTPINSPAEFDATIAQGIALVDFWAPWCGPCKNLMPVLEDMATKFPEVKFVKVNADDQPDIAEKFGLASLPTLLLFQNGRMVNKQVGAPSRSQLKDFVESAL